LVGGAIAGALIIYAFYGMGGRSRGRGTTPERTPLAAASGEIPTATLPYSARLRSSGRLWFGFWTPIVAAWSATISSWLWGEFDSDHLLSFGYHQLPQPAGMAFRRRRLLLQVCASTNQSRARLGLGGRNVPSPRGRLWRKEGSSIYRSLAASSPLRASRPESNCDDERQLSSDPTRRGIW